MLIKFSIFINHAKNYVDQFATTMFAEISKPYEGATESSM